jgi:hypothetical protein
MGTLAVMIMIVVQEENVKKNAVIPLLQCRAPMTK